MNKINKGNSNDETSNKKYLKLGVIESKRNW